MSDQTPTPRGFDPEVGITPTPSIREATNELRAATAEKAREIKSAATETAQQVKDSAVEHWQDTCGKAKELRISSEDYIRQNPTKSVLYAVGLGFVVGLIVRR